MQSSWLLGTNADNHLGPLLVYLRCFEQVSNWFISMVKNTSQQHISTFNSMCVDSSTLEFIRQGTEFNVISLMHLVSHFFGAETWKAILSQKSIQQHSMDWQAFECCRLIYTLLSIFFVQGMYSFAFFASMMFYTIGILFVYQIYYPVKDDML